MAELVIEPQLEYQLEVFQKCLYFSFLLRRIHRYAFVHTEVRFDLLHHHAANLSYGPRLAGSGQAAPMRVCNITALLAFRAGGVGVARTLICSTPGIGARGIGEEGARGTAGDADPFHPRGDTARVTSS